MRILKGQMPTFLTVTLLLLVAISSNGVWIQYYSQYGNGYGYQHLGGGSGGHGGGHESTNIVGQTFGGHERLIGDEHFKLKLWPELHLR